MGTWANQARAGIHIWKVTLKACEEFTQGVRRGGDKQIYCSPVPLFNCPVRWIWGGFFFHLVNSMSRKFLAGVPGKSGSANRNFVIVIYNLSRLKVTPRICEKNARFSKDTQSKVGGDLLHASKEETAHKMLKDETCETVRQRGAAAGRFPVCQG